MAAGHSGVELVVDDACRPLRRSLGPAAWTVLEEALLDARAVDGILVAETSARRIAASLGLSKDTAARALLRLAAAGLLERQDQRDHERGTFAGCRYVLDPAAAELLRPGSGHPRAAGASAVDPAAPSLWRPAVPL